MSRVFSVLIAFFISLGMAQAGDRVRIRVQGLPGGVSMAPHAIAERAVIKAFGERYPHIEVVPAQGLQVEGLNAEATTIMMIAGGIAPDVLLMTFRSSDTYIQQGLVVPLDLYLEGGLEEIEMAPQIRPVVHKMGPEGQRHLYALPIKLLVNGLYFNRPLFREAGLPERAPQDWDELLEFAKKISALRPRYHGLFMLSGSSASMNLMSFLWSAGGEPIEEVSPYEWRATFDTPAGVTAYLFYYRLAVIERVVLRQPQWPQPQSLQDVGMFFQNVGDTRGPRLDPEVWGFGAAPVGPSGKRGAAINAELLGICSQTTDPKVREAAWRYIRFVTSEEADRIRVTSMVEGGQASLVNPVALERFGFHEYLMLAPKGLKEEFRLALETAHPEPYGKNCNLIYTEMSYPIDRLLLDRELKQLWEAGDQSAVEARAAGVLRQAAMQTNLRMLGYVPPAELGKRRVVAFGVVTLVVLAFGWVGWRMVGLFSDSARKMSRPIAGRSMVPWLCMIPALGLVAMWSYLPLIRGTVLAFLDYRMVLPSTFAGLDNFANVLFYGPFWSSLLATLHYAFWTLTFGFCAPILLAYALHLLPKYGIVYRTVFYLPAVISGTAVFFLWRELFSIDGVLNSLLRFAGFTADRAWTEDPYLAMISCVLPSIWAGAGPGCLIYLAALKTIPGEQFEASEIDGASFWAKTVHIVFPGLKALVVINFIGAVSAAFHGATNILIMTGGGPNGLTEVSSLLIFFEAFTRLRFGPATAMAWIIGSMLVGFTVVQLQRLSNMEFKTAR